MKEGHRLFLYAIVIASILVLSGMFFLSRNKISKSSAPKLSASSSSESQVQVASPSPNPFSKNASTNGNLRSVEELSDFIKKLSGDINAIYSRVLPMRVTEKAWWRDATDFSSLLDVARDESVNEAGRIVALQFFLAGVPQPELEKLSDNLQTTFSTASDSMVAALLQGMADRNVSPQSLIQKTLINPDRGENAKCLAWYAARLTDNTNPALASLAVQAGAAGTSASSKVAFDYLASAPYSAQFVADPVVQVSVGKLVEKAKTLPADASIMEMANADAMISAAPKIMDGNRVKETLLDLLESSPNPEVRLSALDQLIILQTNGTEDVSAELNQIKENIPDLFPDESTQIRANARLKRLR